MNQRFKYPARPKLASYGVWLLYLSVALGMIKYVLTPDANPDTIPYAMALTVVIVSFSMVLTLTFLVSIGFNWARILFTAMFGLGLVSAVAGKDQHIDIVFIGQTLMQGAAFVLLYMPVSSAWFRDMKNSRKELRAKMKAEGAEEARRAAERKAQAKALKEREKAEKKG